MRVAFVGCGNIAIPYAKAIAQTPEVELVGAFDVQEGRAGSLVADFGGTAYATGELVNSQLGIIFDSYNAETRHLVFKDKTGAIVERRN